MVRCGDSRRKVGSDELKDQQLRWRLGGIREVHFPLFPYVVTHEYPQGN
jgi:hypothetical protein